MPTIRNCHNLTPYREKISPVGRTKSFAKITSNFFDRVTLLFLRKCRNWWNNFFSAKWNYDNCSNSVLWTRRWTILFPEWFVSWYREKWKFWFFFCLLFVGISNKWPDREAEPNYGSNCFQLFMQVTLLEQIWKLLTSF